MADKSNLPDKRRPGLISRTLKALEEGLTGVGAEIEQKGALQSIGQVLHRMRGKTLVEDLHREWMRLRQSGKIEPDYEESAQYLDCLHEIFEFLDNDIPDEARFNAIKKIFLVAASEEISVRDDSLPQHYIRLCKALSPGAVMVMLTEYVLIAKNPLEGSFPRSTSVKGWQNGIAANSGLGHAEMVALFEDELIDSNILTPKGPVDTKQTTITQQGRLTGLGWGLCEFIAHADSLL